MSLMNCQNILRLRREDWKDDENGMFGAESGDEEGKDGEDEKEEVDIDAI